MRLTWTLLAVLAAVAAAHATDLKDLIARKAEDFRSNIKASPSETDPTFEERIKDLLENFKSTMRAGRPDFRIPVLDPAVVDRLPTGFQYGPFNAKIFAQNSKIVGASEFKVTGITGVDANRIGLEIEVPEVGIEGVFDMKGKVQIGFVQKTLDNKGPYTLNIKGIKLGAQIDILPNDDGSYNIKKVDVSAWTLDSVHIQCDNILGGGFFGKEANKLLNQFFPSFIESKRENINTRLETMTQNLLNKYLDGLAGKESADLVAKIEELSESFRTAMTTGRKELDIPVMDPAVVSDLAIQIHHWPGDAQISTKNIQVTGASQFQLTQIAPIDGTNTVSLDLLIPLLDFSCDYDLQSAFKIGPFAFNFKRNGPLKLAVQGLHVTATAQMIIDTDGYLSTNQIQVDSWTYDGIKLYLENFADGNIIKKTVNSLVNSLVPSLLVKPHAAKLGSWAADTSQRVISHFLDAVAGRAVIANLDATAAKLLEELKTVMKNGSADDNIPVLDPATIKEVPVSINQNLLEGTITLKDIVVAGASDYTVTQISQRDGSNELDVHIAVGDITANGDFDIDGKVKLVIPLPIKDQGSVTVNIKGLEADATAAMASHLYGGLLLKELWINSWTYQEVTADFENLHNGGPAGKALNNVINKVIPAVIKLENAKLTAWATKTVKSVLDQFLAAQSTSETAVLVTHISPEAIDDIKKLVLLAVRSGLAQAA